MVGDFLQSVRDIGDILSDLEPADTVKESYSMTENLQRLEDVGFFVFGAREVQIMQGGVKNELTPWPVAYIRVTRKGSDSVINVNMEELRKSVQQTKDTGNAK